MTSKFAWLAGIGVISAVMGFGQDGVNCSFQSNPDEFLSRQSRIRGDIHTRAIKTNAILAATGSGATVAPSAIERKNFIDEEIFGRLQIEGVRSARLTNDEEFVRRIYLDLTGHIPTPDQFRSFLKSTAGDKREALVENLLYSPEFNDRWTMWLGDLVGNNRAAFNINQQTDGRNAMYDYIRATIVLERSIRDFAYELIVAKGNNYDVGPSNWAVRANVGNGPVQDRYDYMMSRSAGTFLGVSHYDCLLCHDGRNHLDLLSLWGKGTTRLDAYKMAAFFSRMDIRGRGNTGDFYTNSNEIVDRVTGTYDLNTNYGNRPYRVKIGSLLNLTPEYRNGKAPAATGDWRSAFADQLTGDPMFAINFANRLWKQMFSMGMVEPVDTLDPARLDPKNPPPDGWALQATHPDLLVKLAKAFTDNNYQIRPILRLMVNSNAYQMSSRYDDDWSLANVPLFARHFSRRMEAEEIHDAIVQSTQVFQPYKVQGWPDTVKWAYQLPDTDEPLNNEGNGRTFMNSFLRGNRDTQPRQTNGSILQQLSLMNDSFVYNRARVASSPVLTAISKMTGNDAAIDELFVSFLARNATAAERTKMTAFLAKATTAAARNTAIEDLAWVLINKTDFLFSY